MTEFFERRTQLFDSTTPEILDQIASTERRVRERAIAALTQPLDQKSETDLAIFGAIPLELIARNDVLGAIWFIETVGKLGNTIAWEVVEKVFECAVSDRADCLLRGDEDSAMVVLSSLDSLFRMAKAHPAYQHRGELYLLIGKHEEIKSKPYKALASYNKAIEFGSMDGYIASANVYEALGRYEESLAALEAGWSSSADVKFLGKAIAPLCKAGKISEALKKYDEFKGMNPGVIPPFLVYKGRIENDNEVRELEGIIAQYTTELSCVPLTSLEILTSSCAYYIAESVHGENEELQRLHAQPEDGWTAEDSQEYVQIIHRRLSLMQMDILSLGNHRYIDYYLSDLKKLGIEGSPYAKRILQDFFAEYSSKEVENAMREMEGDDADKTVATPSRSEKDRGERRTYDPNTLLESISLHVSRVGELYFSGSFYDLQESCIVPLLRDCAKLEGDYDEKMEMDLSESLTVLKNQSDYYYSLRPNVRESYEYLIRQFDEKHGVFYRKHIQFLATNGYGTHEKYPPALREHHDVGFLFWVEKIMAGQIGTSDPGEIDEIVGEYSLDQIDQENALLFGAILHDISPRYVIEFLADYPDMLDVPEAIYIITEVLRCMDQKTLKEAIRDLHELAKDQYSARGFFEHIRCVFSDIYRNNPTDEDTQYMLLASGNVAILQGKEEVQAIMNFRTAGEFGSLEGLIQAGNFCQDRGEYDAAIGYFEQAFCKDPTVVVVANILNCTLRAGRFDRAQIYIDYALREGLSIGNYIIASYLGQGKTRPAFLQVISMIRSKTGIIDMPAGLITLLFDTLTFVLNMDDTHSGEEDELKIMASFIIANITCNDTAPEPEVLMNHWYYIASLCNCCEGAMLHEKIQRSLGAIVGDREGDSSMDALSDISAELIQTYAIDTHHIFRKMLEASQKEGNLEKTKKIFALINEFCATVGLLLQRFPGTESRVSLWITALNFTPINRPLGDMPKMLQ